MLMDVTYRICRLAIPLFFLVVKTNVGFTTVASFATQHEDAEAIGEALQKIKDYITPHDIDIPYFMVDFCKAEINALKKVFPESKVFLCDFHRGQAWLRWLRTKENKCTDQKTTVFEYLKAVGNSYTEEQFEANLAKLRDLPIWKREEKLRNYITNTWLPQAKVNFVIEYLVEVYYFLTCIF